LPAFGKNGSPSPELPGAGAAAYLDVDAIVAAATATGCDTLHPGYGFLSENPAFAEIVEKLGLKFIGPRSEMLRLMGNKVQARNFAEESGLPLLPGAREAIERMAERWPLGLASSSNRPVIDLVLDRMGVAAKFAATVSSEEVGRGKPAPDVYLEAARRLSADPQGCAAIEDSENGIRSAHAAGMRVLAIPNPHFPPADDALALADVRLPDLDSLSVERVAG
jgi:HAD superfamily hydrolase (TIGR01509 family)